MCVFKTLYTGLHSLPTSLSSRWSSFLSKGTAGLVFILIPGLRFPGLALAILVGLIDADGPTYSLGFDTCDSEREI